MRARPTVQYCTAWRHSTYPTYTISQRLRLATAPGALLVSFCVVATLKISTRDCARGASPRAELLPKFRLLATDYNHSHNPRPACRTVAARGIFRRCERTSEWVMREQPARTHVHQQRRSHRVSATHRAPACSPFANLPASQFTRTFVPAHSNPSHASSFRKHHHHHHTLPFVSLPSDPLTTPPPPLATPHEFSSLLFLSHSFVHFLADVSWVLLPVRRIPTTVSNLP